MRSLLILSLFAASCYNPDVSGGSFACITTGPSPQCPDGYSCVPGVCSAPFTLGQGQTQPDGCCVKSSGGGGGLPAISIPKSGAPYSGPHTDPMLNTTADCPDGNLEPNDGPNEAISAPPLMPDQSTPKIIKLAICPQGNNPATGNHDVDFYKIDNSAGPASLTLMAQAFYDISFGDLDVGIYDAQLNPLSVDGTAVSNGCAAAQISNGTSGSGNGVYYVVVAGANNVDVNRYELSIRSFTTPQPCPTM